ncbi:MAG: hypothetical protein Q4D80_00760 [Pseudomonadota bacterium]|nr:hypothetical protein [Pseudomonadota bacterium]
MQPVPDYRNGNSGIVYFTNGSLPAFIKPGGETALSKAMQWDYV